MVRRNSASGENKTERGWKSGDKQREYTFVKSHDYDAIEEEYHRDSVAENYLSLMHAFSLSMYFSTDNNGLGKDEKMKYIHPKIPIGISYDTMFNLSLSKGRNASLYDVLFIDPISEYMEQINFTYHVKYLLYTYIQVFFNRLLKIKMDSDSNFREWRSDIIKVFTKLKLYKKKKNRITFTEETMKLFILKFSDFVNEHASSETSLHHFFSEEQFEPEEYGVKIDAILENRNRKFNSISYFYHANNINLESKSKSKFKIPLMEVTKGYGYNEMVNRYVRGLASLFFLLGQIECGHSEMQGGDALRFSPLDKSALYILATAIDSKIVVINEEYVYSTLNEYINNKHNRKSPLYLYYDPETTFYNSMKSTKPAERTSDVISLDSDEE